MRTVFSHGFLALSARSFEFGHVHADNMFAVAVKGHLALFARGVLDEAGAAFRRDTFGERC